MATQIEHTDTFGGEANYCWANRYWCASPLTDKQTILMAKRLTGLTGVRCRKEDHGETIALFPAGICHVVFINYVEDEHAQGQQVDAQGNPVESEG